MAYWKCSILAPIKRRNVFLHWDDHWSSKGASALGTRLGLFRFFQAEKKIPLVFLHHDSNSRTDRESTGNPRRSVHQRSSSLYPRTIRTTTVIRVSCTVRVIGIFMFGVAYVEPATSTTFIVRCLLQALKRTPIFGPVLKVEKRPAL